MSLITKANENIHSLNTYFKKNIQTPLLAAGIPSRCFLLYQQNAPYLTTSNNVMINCIILSKCIDAVAALQRLPQELSTCQKELSLAALKKVAISSIKAVRGMCTGAKRFLPLAGTLLIAISIVGLSATFLNHLNDLSEHLTAMYSTSTFSFDRSFECLIDALSAGLVAAELTVCLVIPWTLILKDGLLLLHKGLVYTGISSEWKFDVKILSNDLCDLPALVCGQTPLRNRSFLFQSIELGKQFPKCEQPQEDKHSKQIRREVIPQRESNQHNKLKRRRNFARTHCMTRIHAPISCKGQVQAKQANKKVARQHRCRLIRT